MSIGYARMYQHGVEYTRFEAACIAAACAVLEGATVQPAKSPKWTTLVKGRFRGIEGEVQLRQIVMKQWGREISTHVRLVTPIAGADLDLHPFDPKVIGHHLEVDLASGDPAFDAAFTIEGAPAAVVKPLVDAALRAEIGALSAQCTARWTSRNVRLVIDAESVGVSFARGVDQPAGLARLLSLAATVLARLGPLMASVAADPNASAIAAAELRDLHARRRAQDRRALAGLLIILGVLLAIFVAVGVLIAWRVGG